MRFELTGGLLLGCASLVKDVRRCGSPGPIRQSRDLFRPVGGEITLLASAGGSGRGGLAVEACKMLVVDLGSFDAGLRRCSFAGFLALVALRVDGLDAIDELRF